MSPLLRKALSRPVVAAIPIGMAATFALQAPAASAAPAAGMQQASAARLLTVSSAQGLVQGATIRHRAPRRLRAYRWARRQAGHPYVYGGTGPGYDCSGLVMKAYAHVGIRLPRTTYGMLASPKLIRVRHPRIGDLAFYGTGHVELFRRWGYTFGAHDYGSPVGLIHYGYGWKPTAFYRVR